MKIITIIIIVITILFWQKWRKL